MIPFPDALQLLYADLPDVEMSRPWWRWDSSGKFRAATRNGRTEISARYLRDLEKYDSEHPIERPSFRTGQVWADEFGQTVQIVERDGITFTTIHNGAVKRWDLNGGTTFQRTWPFLLADPIRPDQAPWSPSVGSDGY
jgi:hypothetical protein